MRRTILVADDDSFTRNLFEGLFRQTPARVEFARNAAQARQLFKETDFNLIIMDQRLPDGSGLDLLREMRAERPQQMAVLITAYADVRDAVRAVREGLFDYLTKPFEHIEELEVVIEKALELDRAYREINALRASINADPKEPVFIGASPPVEQVLQQVRQIAKLDITILLEGESGTGKDLLAKLIHNAGTRRQDPFLELNCGAMSESLLETTLFGFQRGAFTGANKNTPGYFEQADGGTLFLDEIADMSPKLQSTLLSVLQNRRFTRLGATKVQHSDFRLICATNRRLADEVVAGRFREDLFYRINVVDIRLPPLRERTDDIVLLAVHFLELFNSRFHKSVGPFNPEAIHKLEQASWPGNVRQLQHLVERVVALHAGGPISDADLELHINEAEQDVSPSAGKQPRSLLSYREEREAFEKEYLQRVLLAAKGNVSEAARLSGVARQNLYTRMKRLGIDTQP